MKAWAYKIGEVDLRIEGQGKEKEKNNWKTYLKDLEKSVS